jgi:MPBQ/MSBQ methyltransferase
MLTEYQAVLTDSYDRFFRDFLDDLYVGDRANMGYANLGIFLPDTPDFATACDNMMERVVSKLSRHDGPLLDVGCGLGGTSSYLARHFPPSRVHGINVSDYQISECRARVPDAHFEVMSAEQMHFPDLTFDTVVSVEAALHFKGRREFLNEAWRVLKPGGEIVVADIVFNNEPRVFRKVLAGQEVYENLSDYTALWQGCGFKNVQIEDITRASLRAFVSHFKSKALAGLLGKQIDATSFNRLLTFVRDIETLPVLAYVIASASKPK